jgi:hypothetical protein
MQALATRRPKRAGLGGVLSLMVPRKIRIFIA